MKIRKNKKGFTLVELVVVIAIMAVLAGTVTAVTIPLINRSRKSTLTDTAALVERQMALYAGADDFADTGDGFKNYMSENVPDVVYNNSTNLGQIKSCPDSSVHYAISKTSNLRGQTWDVLVYDKYYKVKITFGYDTNKKQLTTPKAAEAVKIGD